MHWLQATIAAQLPMRLGGKISPLSGDPLDVLCTVMALHQDMVMTGLSNTPTPLGDCAWVRAAGVDVVLISLRNQAMHTDLFTQLGIELSQCKLVVVKSSQHFYASFAPLAAKVIYVQAPGAVTHDLHSLPYSKIQRPKWPLDDLSQEHIISEML